MFSLLFIHRRSVLAVNITYLIFLKLMKECNRNNGVRFVIIFFVHIIKTSNILQVINFT